jgi:hypothetical protein
MALREHSVTGTILLLDIDAEVLNGFGLKTLGARAPIRRDIENLRLRSHKYHDYARATSDEDSRVAHTAKRRRPLSPPYRPNRMQYLNFAQQSFSLFSSSSPLDKLACPKSQADAMINFDQLSSMPQEKLSSVIEMSFRLHAAGPRRFEYYIYRALIKTDINSPKLSGDEIAKLIEEIYAGDVDDITTDILSPGLTVVDGLLDPLGNRTKDSSGAE